MRPDELIKFQEELRDRSWSIHESLSRENPDAEARMRELTYVNNAIRALGDAIYYLREAEK